MNSFIKNYKAINQLFYTQLQYFNKGMAIRESSLFNFCTLLLALTTLMNLRLMSQHIPHDLNISYFFNYYFLGNTNLDMYEDEDNISECFQKYILFSDMSDHFRNVFETIYNYNDFVRYECNPDNQMHEIQIQYRNGTVFKQNMEVSEIQAIIMQDLKQFLNSIYHFQIKYQLGSDTQYQIIKLTMSYQIKKNWYLSANIQPILSKYTNKQNLIYLQILRYIILLLAFSNLFIQFYSLYSNKIHQIQANFWPYIIISLNLGIILSQKWTILFAYLQIVPILEKFGNKYLFSFALRYSLPIILPIQLTVCIVLNGIIIYSIIQYPSSLFQDFKKSFFSYFYNNFQLATYEIFLQIQGRGIVAYVVYLGLYFYMVLVAHSLIPSLFCGLVRKKRRQRAISDFLENIETKCPNCGLNSNDKSQFENNMQVENINKTDGINDSNYEIEIYSPKFKGLVQNKLLRNEKIKGKNVKKFIIESEQIEIREKNRSQRIFYISEKIQYSVTVFQEIILQIDYLRQEKYDKIIKNEFIKKLQLIQKIKRKLQ